MRLVVVFSQNRRQPADFHKCCCNSEATRLLASLLPPEKVLRHQADKSFLLELLSFGLRALHGPRAIRAACTSLSSDHSAARLSRLTLSSGSRLWKKGLDTVAFIKVAEPSLIVRRLSESQSNSKLAGSGAGRLSQPAGFLQSGRQRTSFRCSRWRDHPFSQLRCSLTGGAAR